jgi:ethanolamine ammonia-lyase small subunit
MNEPAPQTPNPWLALRRLTPARIALGRAGGSLPTAEVLAFSAAHAAARDAVHSALDLDALERDLAPLGRTLVRLASGAADRTTYLSRPDLGRRLDDASRAALAKLGSDARGHDLAIVIGDGLSALAVQRQAAPLLAELLPVLAADGVSVGPVVAVVRHARVAVEDEVGEALGARAALVLIGERPGLGSPDSLGAYLVYGPRVGRRTDADRNCVSNIRPAGLAFAPAAATLRYLVTNALRRKLSGVALKDERALPSAGAPKPIGG